MSALAVRDEVRAGTLRLGDKQAVEVARGSTDWFATPRDWMLIATVVAHQCLEGKERILKAASAPVAEPGLRHPRVAMWEVCPASLESCAAEI